MSARSCAVDKAIGVIYSRENDVCGATQGYLISP